MRVIEARSGRWFDPDLVMALAAIRDDVKLQKEWAATAEEIRALPLRLAKPQLMNMVIGGKTPIFGMNLGTVGFLLNQYPHCNLALGGWQSSKAG